MMPDLAIGNLIAILYFNFGFEFVRLWQIILNGYLLSYWLPEIHLHMKLTKAVLLATKVGNNLVYS